MLAGKDSVRAGYGNNRKRVKRGDGRERTVYASKMDI